MPQVWVTYGELGQYLNMDSEAARDFVHTARWSCRRSQDGHTRTKLPPDIALTYMATFVSDAAADMAADIAADMARDPRASAAAGEAARTPSPPRRTAFGRAA